MNRIFQTYTSHTYHACILCILLCTSACKLGNQNTNTNSKSQEEIPGRVDDTDNHNDNNEDGKEGFTYLNEAIPGIILEVRYFSDDNFMGRRADGYKKPVILITQEAAAALKKVQQELNTQNLGLKVFDAYRPQKAVNSFIRWARDPADTLTKVKYYPNLPKDRLFELGYIAERSGHTRGSTLDLTLVYLDSGKEVNMGSPWDFFGEISHHDSPLVNESATANRNLLREVMTKYGFRPYANEWWHYTLEGEPYPDTYFNFDVE